MRRSAFLRHVLISALNHREALCSDPEYPASSRVRIDGAAVARIRATEDELGTDQFLPPEAAEWVWTVQPATASQTDGGRYVILADPTGRWRLRAAPHLLRPADRTDPVIPSGTGPSAGSNPSMCLNAGG